MTSTPGVLVDDNVLEVLRKAQLDGFVNKFIFQFNVRRFDHFSHVRDKDMQEIGMTQPQIRHFREQILKMSCEMWNRSDPKQIYVQGDHSTPQQSTIDEKALIPNEQIKIFELLGEGSFAVVKRGTWTQSNGQRVDVAVKILRDISPNIMDDLRVEASHLLKLQHPSLIRLYGIVRQPAMMVFELCEGGSLLDRLRDDKKPIPLVSRLHDYCMQIAKALQFLESKHCVHRDVAARNILVAKDEKTVKICDFGLMRALKENEQMYTMAPQKKVPFAWCPPEALRHRKFSHASDVWSYGITIWEIFTFGEEPWVGCRAIDVLKNMDAGERLEKPKYCSDRIYQVMQNCWKSNPAERCKFGAIREDLKAAMFLEAVARETYNSIQPGSLTLTKGDEVVVIENTGQDWYGQHKRNLKFGVFPRTVVFAQANHVVAAQTAVTPQKLPTAPTIRVPPQHNVQPSPLPFAPKPLNNNSITSLNDRSSRISMPVAGSFIHTGHGDPLGGNSWGNPSAIDEMYLKNPVKGVPLSSASNGAQLIASKEQLTNGGRSTHIPAAPSAVSSQLRGLSLDLPEYDDFDRAFDDGFSPSKIELPRDFGNESMFSNGTINTILIEGPKPVEPKFDIRGNVLKPMPIERNDSQPTTIKPTIVVPSSTGAITMPIQTTDSKRSSRFQPEIEMRQNNAGLPMNFLPELESRLDNGNAMRPRPASSIGIQNNALPSYGGNIQRPFSVVNAPTAPLMQQPTSIPCLVPTPAPVPVPSHGTSLTQMPTSRITINQSSTLQKALAEELKGNLRQRPMSSSTVTTSQGPKEISSASNPRPVLQQKQVSNNSSSVPASVQSRNPYQPQQVRLPPVSSAPFVVTSTPALKTIGPSVAAPVPKAVVSSQPQLSKNVPPSASVSMTPATSLQSDVTRRPNTVSQHTSDEERRSKIIMDINSALGPPSSLLLGSTTSTSSMPTANPSAPSLTTAATVKPANFVPSQPQPAMPPKKTSEPILSTEVLQPTRLPTASTSVARPAAPLNAHPARNQSLSVVNNKQTTNVYKKASMPTQSTTNVPLFNITNSSNVYPQLGAYPNYGNGYQPYGFGMQYNGYQGYNAYNPYTNGMGQLALTYNAGSSLPPFAPSENRFTGTTKQLGDSEIMELLGQPNRQATAVAPAPVTQPAPQRQQTTNDVTMADKMEVLYKEADFTYRGNCDTMVMYCNGDTEMALKVLKQQHLVEIGVAKSKELARQALESCQYDLTAAANFLLG